MNYFFTNDKIIFYFCISTLLYLTIGTISSYFYIKNMQNRDIKEHGELAHEAAYGILGGCMFVMWWILLPHEGFILLRREFKKTS